jgi:hypothetical protein
LADNKSARQPKSEQPPGTNNGRKGSAMPPPIDSAPERAEVLHQQSEPKLPEPRPGEQSDEPVRGQPGAGGPDSVDRPALPGHPVLAAADIEDEDGDPVIDDGPGIADGVTGVREPRG